MIPASTIQEILAIPPMSRLRTTLFIFSWLVGTVVCAEPTEILFTIGEYANRNDPHYANNLRLQKTLTIPSADALEVTIEGEIEDCCQSPANENVARCCRRAHNKRCCDFIIIRDNTNQDYVFNGQIQEKFTVPGHFVTVIFHSDNTTTGKGVRVSIAQRSAYDMFNELKDRLLDAAEIILKQDAGEAYLKLETQLKHLEILSRQVENTHNIEEVVEPVARMFITLGQTYRDIATQRAAIQSVYQTQLNLIKSLRANTSAKIDKAKQDRQNFSIRLEKMQLALYQTLNSSEKQKGQLEISACERSMEMLQMQEAVWTDFYKTQETLENLLQQHIQNVELLLHFLEVNGQVYEQAAKVALLKETTVMAFDQLVDLAELQNIVSDVEQSEQAVVTWMERVKQAKSHPEDTP